MKTPSTFRFGRTLGRGAVAEVVELIGPHGERYAGKLLHSSHVADDGATARFEQEAALLEGVEHPNLVRVVGMTELDRDGRLCSVLLLELVEGPTLQDELACHGPFSATKTCQLALGIARGLAAAHDAGLVHRDLKPANILLAGDTPKIADFGMARASSLAGSDPSTLTVLGTPDYMAPECIDALAVDPRSDLYALGVMMYEMLTGTVPYRAATSLAILAAHRDQPIPALPSTVEPQLAAIVTELLAKAPGDRPQAASLVVTRLEKLLDVTQSTALAASHDLVDDGVSRCTACGRPLVRYLQHCVDCGVPIVHFEAGGNMVMVVGPGELGDKFDSRLRETVTQFLHHNPGLGLVPSMGFRKRIPRLPFVLARRVSDRCAASLVAALGRLGIVAECHRGGALGSTKMRRKTTKLVGRAAVIGMTAMAGMTAQRHMWIGMLVVMASVTAGTGVAALVPVTRRRAIQSGTLSKSMRAALSRVDSVLPSIRRDRHRQAVGAVVRRALTLGPALARGAHAVAVDDELGKAIVTASVAASRLDALDSALESVDIRTSDESTRRLLHDRDTWSSRLLALTAELDAVQARVAATERESDEVVRRRLEDVRLRLEALEEVDG